MKKIIYTKDAPKAIGPYSQAILSNNTLYCSGQIAIDCKGNLKNESIEEETKQIIKNKAAVLKKAEMDFSNVGKTTIFLKDMNDFSIVNNIYQKTFENEPPARETVEVSRLPKDVNIEISVIASF